MQKRHELTPTHERMRVERCRHLLNRMEDGMLPNLVFSDEKKFDVEQCVNHQNDCVWGKNASVEGRRVSRRQNLTSVMVWVGRHSHWKVSSRFRALRSKIEHPAVHLGYFGRWTVAMGQRALRGSSLDLPARLGALTWLKNDPTVDSGPHPGVHQQGRLALKEPGPEFFGLFCVALLSRSILESKVCRTSHDSIFFVFIREPDQNVRCHKFGGPYTVDTPWLTLSSAVCIGSISFYVSFTHFPQWLMTKNCLVCTRLIQKSYHPQWKLVFCCCLSILCHKIVYTVA